jgi:hypothetical protein
MFPKPLLVLVVLLFCGWGWRAGGAVFAAPATASVSLTDYWALVAESHAVVQGLHDAPPTTVQSTLQELANRWQAITLVETTDGASLAVDPSLWVAELRRDPPDLPRLEGLLTTLLAAQDHWPPPQFPTFPEAELAAILARPEFQDATQEPSAFLRWFNEQLERLAAWLARWVPSPYWGGAFELVTTAVALVLLAALLFYALRGILGDFAAEVALPDEDETSSEPLTADSALRRAQLVYSGGDYRTAVRYLYLSALLRLEERGLLRYDRTLTNREVLRRVAQEPALAAVLSDVVEVFDRVWYGYHPLDEPSFQRYAATVEDLKNYR